MVHFLLTFVSRGRDFFKLSRIELRCETLSGEIIVVDPWENIATKSFYAEHSISPSIGSVELFIDSSPDIMDIDQHAVARNRNQDDDVCRGPHQQTSPLQNDSDRPTLPSPSLIRDAEVTSPHRLTNGVLASFTSATPLLQEKPCGVNLSPLENNSSLIDITGPSEARNHVTTEALQTNGHRYPRPSTDVAIDAIERLQTQISQNSGALAAHTRDIRRGEESFVLLEETIRRD